MFQNKKLHVKIIETKNMFRTIYPKFLLYALFIILKFSQNYLWKKKNPNLPSKIKSKSIITTLIGPN
jgi:hypothetical protein